MMELEGGKRSKRNWKEEREEEGTGRRREKKKEGRNN